MINIIGILICIGLFHIFVYPVMLGFYHGYRDAKNGRPYNLEHKDGEEEQYWQNPNWTDFSEDPKPE